MENSGSDNGVAINTYNQLRQFCLVIKILVKYQSATVLAFMSVLMSMG